MSTNKIGTLRILCLCVILLFSTQNIYAAGMPILANSRGYSPVATTHQITIHAFQGGSTIPSGTTTVLDGGTLNIYIMPDSGWEIGTVTVDNLPVGPISSYVFTNVKANHTLTVTYKAKPTTPSCCSMKRDPSKNEYNQLK